MLAHKHFFELVSLTKDYIKQELSSTNHIFVNKEMLGYFNALLKSTPPPSSPPSTHNLGAYKTTNKEAPPLIGNKTQSQMVKAESQTLPKVSAIPITTVSQEPPLPSVSSSTPKFFQSTPSFILEPFNSSPRGIDKQGFSHFFRTHFPAVHLKEEPLCDAIAKKQKSKWMHDKEMPPIIILSFNENEKQIKFLSNLAHALTLRLAPAKVISSLKCEEDQLWDSLFNSPSTRLIIASDYGIYTHAMLMKNYREIPQTGEHFLNKIPLLLLSEISLYMKGPQLKSVLWRTICNTWSATSHE